MEDEDQKRYRITYRSLGRGLKAPLYLVGKEGALSQTSPHFVDTFYCEMVISTEDSDSVKRLASDLRDGLSRKFAGPGADLEMSVEEVIKIKT